MEISNKNGFVEFVKRYGVYAIVGIVMFAIALTFTLAATLGASTPTSTTPTLSFSLPMQNAMIVKDYSATELQKNDTLNQWEAHLAIDMTSENKEVFSVLDGEVVSVDYDFLDGNTVTIKHTNGFISEYSSLSNENLISVGSKVVAGQKIGEASETASSELDLGSHLHFAMKLNNKTVDPNDYLDLQQK